MAEDTRSTSTPAPRASSGTDDTVPARSPPEPSDDPTQPVASADRYRLGAELGRGGMGRVVEAFDTQLGRTVAFKEVLPKGGAGVARRFVREVQITARLEHPSIVPLYDSGTTHDGRPFYVMRRVTGRPLDQLIMGTRELPERLALLPHVLAAIDAVGHAHRRGVIHRDLKPANILIGEQGETVVIDWGLAKVIGEEDPSDPGELRTPTAADSLQTQVGSVFGTPGFMPPEQARGEELGPRGDVFALGATLYHLLSGRPPATGSSATEVISSTLRHTIVPIQTACPGAPPELATIIVKALAFEAADRYADAGALAEDVRRFTTGQLVAAHRYTRWQRFARFARRHRAALLVAALASVAVAVVAWISVHSILQERDHAREARGEAEARRRDAEQARDALQDKNDALLLARARSALGENPTLALALVKELRPDSLHVADAEAIAAAAVARGVAWALPYEKIVRFAELSPDGSRLVAVSGDGTLTVWDLEGRHQLLERTGYLEARFAWITGRRLLVSVRKGPAEIIDPSTAVVTTLPFVIDSWPRATPAGDRAVVVLATGEAELLDVATRHLQPLWPGQVAELIEVARDGSFAAASNTQRVVVVDSTGHELAHHDGHVTSLAVSAAGHVGVLVQEKHRSSAWELDTHHLQSGWKELSLGDPPGWAVGGFYRGEELDVITAGGLRGYTDGQVTRRIIDFEYGSQSTPDAAHGVAVVARRDGRLHFVDDHVTGDILLPSVMPGTLAVAGKPGVTRLAVVGFGAVAIFDLADVIPVGVGKPGALSAGFVDDDTVLLLPDSVDDYRWFDVVSRTSTAIHHSGPPSPHVEGVDVRAGRMFVDAEVLPRVDEVYVFAKGRTESRKIVRARSRVLVAALDGAWIGAIEDDPRIFGATGDAEAGEIAKVDGGVLSVCALGHSFAALGGNGEIVRGSVTGGVLERSHVALDGGGRVAEDGAGHVAIATGRKLLVWDAAVREVATFDRVITGIHGGDGGITVILEGNAVELVPRNPGAPTRHVQASGAPPPVFSADGSMMATAGNGGEVTLTGLPSLARWTLPRMYGGSDFVRLSPSGHRVLQAGDRAIYIRSIVLPSKDFAAWLDERSNASVADEDQVRWPWQPLPAKP